MMMFPQCRRTYSGEYSFCLSDGTPLVDTTEEPTVVAPRKPAPPRRGAKIIIFVLAALLSLSLGITAAVLYFFWPRSGPGNVNQNQAIASATPRPTATATASETPTPSPQPTR